MSYEVGLELNLELEMDNKQLRTSTIEPDLEEQTASN